MLPTILENAATGDATDFQRTTRGSAPSAGFPRLGSLLRKLAMTTAVWMLYVPHLTILKVLGQELGPGWARFVGRLHWLLTFLGAARSTRAIIRTLRPHLQTDASVATILRKHLELKHECFARIRAFGQQRPADAPRDIEWEVDESFRQRFQKARSSGKGLIIVGYHFGFFRISASALSRVFPGCDAVQVSHRNAHYEGQTVPGVARLALEKALVADQHSGTRIHYVDGESSMVRIFRTLRAGQTVALTADGAFARDFLDVPFFDGKLRLPSGWARLAAATRSNVLILADMEVDHGRRKAMLFDQVHVRDDSPGEIYRAVSQAAGILEELVRRQPWSWHPWPRLRYTTAGDGSPHMFIAELGPGSGRNAGARNARDIAPGTEKCPSKWRTGFVRGRSALLPHCNGGATVKDTTPVSSHDQTNGHAPAGRPRVVIITNSFTPYRIHLHERIANEVPEIELWSLATHSNSCHRWRQVTVPSTIRPVQFGCGEPTNEQTQLRFMHREWTKGGQIIRWLKMNEPAAVLCQGCGDAGRLRILRWCHQHQVPCYLTGDCNIRGEDCRGLKRIVKSAVFRSAVFWSDGIMPCGQYGRSLFERYGAAAKPVFWFPFIPDIALFEDPSQSAVDNARRLLAPNPRRRLLFCGRMVSAKRPDLALAAFAAIATERPDWDLIMCGDGSLRRALESSVPPGLQNRVQWLGFLDDPRDLAGLYANCDVLLLPSDKEPWGVVVVEAAAARLAIVASDVVGASAELVREGRNGAIFTAGNLQELIGALKRVTDPAAIDSLRNESRDVLRDWLTTSDPIDGLRAALAACGVLTTSASNSVAYESTMSSISRHAEIQTAT